MLATSFRSLLRARGFSAVVIITLALGTTALIATFGVVNAALFRLPPFENADRLALLHIDRNERGEAPRKERWSFARYQELRRTQTSFEDVASYSPAAFTVAGDAEGAPAEPVRAERVSAAYFPLLRARAIAGRIFTEAEDDPRTPTPVLLVGHELWARRFASDPAVVGRNVRVNGVAFTVIGVLPRDFTGLSGKAELWVPATMTPRITYAEYLTTNQNFISVFGRLKAGVAFEAASAELATLGAAINRALPSDPDDPDERVTASARTLNDARIDPTVSRSLSVLFAAVALLHLLACANAANLLLGRAAERRRDSAMRLALGSSNRQLFERLFSEGALLSISGSLLGMIAAAVISAVFSPPANLWAPRNSYGSLSAFDAPSFGGTETLFGLSVVLVTTVLVALVPAITAFDINVADGIKAGARNLAGGGLSLRRLSPRGVIVGFETGLAVLLVLVAGLLIESFDRMRRTEIGVDTTNVLTFWVIPSEARVPPAAAPRFVTRLLESIEAVPGVVSASVDGGGPLSGTASSTLVIAEQPEPPPGQAPPVLRHYVGAHHFTTLGIPLLRGRVFGATDVATSPRVTLISASAARRFWPDEDPVGKRVWFGGGSDFDSMERSAEIIGVVGDVVYAPVDTNPNPSSFYTPYTQFTYASRMVFVKTSLESSSVVSGIRRAVAAVDPELGLNDVRPLSEVVSASWARHRFDAWLFGGFGVVALLLSASGIFAVLSYAVATRTREFGVRIALGSTPATMLWQVLREGMAFPLLGLAAGVFASFGVTRVLQSSLYEVSAREPRVFIGAGLLLIASAAIACLVPAWRATRTDPMEALRAE